MTTPAPKAKRRKNYVGKVVFLERNDEKDTYRNGEYVCIRQSPFALYCVSTKGGYDSHEAKAFPLTGTGSFRVIEAITDNEALRALAKELYHFGKTKPGSWVSSVYEGALANAKRLLTLAGMTIDDIKEEVVIHSVHETRDVNKKVILSPQLNKLISEYGTHDVKVEREQIRAIVERIYFEIMTLVQK